MLSPHTPPLSPTRYHYEPLASCPGPAATPPIRRYIPPIRCGIAPSRVVLSAGAFVPGEEQACYRPTAPARSPQYLRGTSPPPYYMLLRYLLGSNNAVYAARLGSLVTHPPYAAAVVPYSTSTL
eukprot:1104210-Rhodomonas_salina.2